MVYTPNPDDATQPTDAAFAETATTEFRGLKAKLNNIMAVGAFLNPLDKGEDILLTAGNIIATQSVALALTEWESVRGNIGTNSIRRFFEVKLVKATRPVFVGVQTLLASLLVPPGTVVNSGVSVNNTGTSYAPDGDNFSTSSPFIEGDVIGVDCDPASGNIGFYLNGAGLISFGGVVFSSYAVFPTISLQGLSDQVYVNFGQNGWFYGPPASSYAYTPPFTITSGIRNIIVNGRCDHDQQNSGAAQLAIASGSYMSDCWRYAATQAGKFNAQQNAGAITPPVGFTNFQGLQSTGAFVVNNNDSFLVDQQIEGYNINHLSWGTAGAKAVTLLFSAYSSMTGVHSGVLCNNVPGPTTNRSFPFNFVIPTANTWFDFAIPIPGDTAGTWPNDTENTGMRLRFNLGAGINFVGPANVWAAADYVGSTDGVSIVGTNGATFYFTGVELKDGVYVAGQPLERITWEESLAAVQRYYLTDNVTVATAPDITGVSFPNPMRVIPTVTGGGAGYAALQVTTYGTWHNQTVGGNEPLVFDARPT